MKIVLPIYVASEDAIERHKAGLEIEDDEVMCIRTVIYGTNLMIEPALVEGKNDTMIYFNDLEMASPIRPKELERLIDDQGPTGFVDAWTHWKRKNEQQ